MGEFLQRFMDPKARFRFQATPTGEVNAPTASDPSEPSLWEVLLMLGMMFAVHLLTVCRVRNFWKLPDMWFDRKDYLEIAGIIRHWHFSGGPTPKFFCGFPYAIAGISKLFSIPGSMAVVIISVLAS